MDRYKTLERFMFGSGMPLPPPPPLTNLLLSNDRRGCGVGGEGGKGAQGKVTEKPRRILGDWR